MDDVWAVGQKRIVIVGAALGMVGGYALRYALETAVGSVTSIGRKKVGISHPKLSEVQHRDSQHCSALAEMLLGQDAVVFAWARIRFGLGRGTPHSSRRLHN